MQDYLADLTKKHDSYYKTVKGLENVKSRCGKIPFSTNLTISQKDFVSLYNGAYNFAVSESNIKKLTSENNKLIEKVSNLENTIEQIKESNKKSISTQIEEKKRIIQLEEISKAFHKLPKEIQEKLLKSNRPKNKSKNVDLE